MTQKHPPNAALSIYISGWIARAHGDAKPETHRALWHDLGKALEEHDVWRSQPRPSVPDLPIAWQSGETRLIDMSHGDGGVPLMFIPSMINGTQVFDMPGASMIAMMRTAGFHPYLLDWGVVRAADADTNVAEYCSKLAEVASVINPSAAIAYCLGGTMTHLARTDAIPRQVLIGAPWYFDHGIGETGRFAAAIKNHPALYDDVLDQLTTQLGVLPSNIIDCFFALLNPVQFIDKFRNRADHPDLALFDAIEDWLNSGRDLPVAFARELILDWIANDALLEKPVSNRPTLVITGTRDHIAPPAACIPLADGNDNATFLSQECGHVGLLVGKRTRREVWPQIVKFLQS